MVFHKVQRYSRAGDAETAIGPADNVRRYDRLNDIAHAGMIGRWQVGVNALHLLRVSEPSLTVGLLSRLLDHDQLPVNALHHQSPLEISQSKHKPLALDTASALAR